MSEHYQPNPTIIGPIPRERIREAVLHPDPRVTLVKQSDDWYLKLLSPDPELCLRELLGELYSDTIAQ